MNEKDDKKLEEIAQKNNFNLFKESNEHLVKSKREGINVMSLSVGIIMKENGKFDIFGTCCSAENTATLFYKIDEMLGANFVLMRLLSQVAHLFDDNLSDSRTMMSGSEELREFLKNRKIDLNDDE